MVERLNAHFSSLPDGLSPASHTDGVATLLGQARYYGLVNDHEVIETVPRTETVLPCYLGTVVKCPVQRSTIDQYVVLASKLYRRGSILLNRIAMTLCGPRHPNAGDLDNVVFRPRYRTGELGAFDALVAYLSPQDARNAPLKHAFLPERWPLPDPDAETEGTTRCPLVDAASRSGWIIPHSEEFHLPCPDWRAVMNPTGWDNALNRMATKYVGNVKVHARANLAKAVDAYLKVVPLYTPAARDAIRDVLCKRLRPLAVHGEDWDMLVSLRVALGAPTKAYLEYLPRDPPYTEALLRLHLFMCRYGVAERSYLPVASRGRKFAYLDAKVMTALLQTARRQQNAKAKPRRGTDGASTSAPEAGSTSLGDVLGVTPALFNAHMKKLHKVARKRRRDRTRKAKKARRARPSERRQRRLRAFRQTMRLGGRGRMPDDAQIASAETDGVGLRLCLKRPIDMRPFVRPLFTVEEAAARAASREAAKKNREAGQKRDAPKTADGAATKRSKKGRKETRGPAEHSDGKTARTTLTDVEPVFAALDTGRCKPYMAAVSHSGIQKPQSLGFTRKRYYSEMRHRAREKWEHGRMAQMPEVAAAVAALAESGGVRNCDPALWRRYLDEEAQHRDMLEEEFIVNKERATWRMVMFCYKKSSLDRAAERLTKRMTRDVPLERPLVLAVGDASFAPTGRGELPSPTSAMMQALKRAQKRVEMTGRRVETMKVWEFRTTKCCCGCGEETTSPMVRDPTTGEMRRSRRLRSCSKCCEPAVKLRDRDVQGARNILFLAMYAYYGATRPWYLCRAS